MGAFDTFVVRTGIKLPQKQINLTETPKLTPKVFLQDADYDSYHRKSKRLECRVRNLQRLLKRAQTAG